MSENTTHEIASNPAQEFQIERAVNSRIHNEKCVPVYRAPTEVLVEIIKQVKAQEANQGSVLEPPRFEVIASQISQRWREAALSSPLLWGPLRMQVRPLNREAALAHLRTRLERSDPAPLDIYLELKIEDDPVELEIYKMLAAHSKRWRTISIITASGYKTDISGLVSGTEAPLLQAFSLSMAWFPVLGIEPEDTGRYCQSAEKTKPIALVPSFACPNLSVVRLGGWARWKIQLPMAGVTTLHLAQCQTYDGKIAPGTLQDLIDSAHSLRHLSVTTQKLCDDKDAPKIELPHLHSLRLILVNPHKICSHISTPNLYSLTLSYPTDHTLYDLQFSRWQDDVTTVKAVKHLVLDHFSAEQDHAIGLFRNLESVQVLTINGGIGLHSLFDALAKPPPRAPSLLLPNLHTLELFNLTAKGVESLIAMLRARQDRAMIDVIKLNSRSKLFLRKAGQYDWITSQMWSVEDTEGESPAAWPPGFKYNVPREKLHWDSVASSKRTYHC